MSALFGSFSTVLFMVALALIQECERGEEREEEEEG